MRIKNYFFFFFLVEICVIELEFSYSPIKSTKPKYLQFAADIIRTL